MTCPHILAQTNLLPVVHSQVFERAGAVPVDFSTFTLSTRLCLLLERHCQRYAKVGKRHDIGWCERPTKRRHCVHDSILTREQKSTRIPRTLQGVMHSRHLAELAEPKLVLLQLLQKLAW